MSVGSHPDEFHSHWSRAAVRERIISDFRDFRLTWRGFFKWSGVTLLAILIAAIVTLYFLDWNQMRGPLGRYLSHRTGREVRIDGNLSVKLFSWQPGVEAGSVYVGNPKWAQDASKTPQAAKVKGLKVELRLMPLLRGHLILPLVRIDQPDILLLRDARGRTNWDGGNKTPSDAWKLPPIRRFLVRDGHIRVDDAVRKLHFTGTVSSEENAGPAYSKDRRAAFTLTGEGTLNQSQFLADLRGGPLLNVDETRPYPFKAEVTAGPTHAVVNGVISQPFHLDRYKAGVTVSGASLADLYFLTGLVLPRTPPYRMSLSVSRDGDLYRLADINALLGGTDLGGNLMVDVSKNIPALTGRLGSRVLVLEDLGPLVGGGKAAPAASRYLLPDTVLHTERLRQTNAEVDYAASAIKSRDFPLRGLTTHISVENGVLNLKPLAFDFIQGKLSGALKVDARNTTPTSTVDARISDIHAETFIKGGDKPISGVLEARAVLTGTGNSVHAAASNASGTFTAVVPSGGMRHSLAEWTGVDVLTALSLNLSGDSSDTNLRCAVASFNAGQGVLTSQQMIIDTEPVRVEGSGSINLRDETLNMQLQGKPKHFQLLRLRAPITVSGPWRHPALGVKAGAAVAQGGIGAALGLLNPFAAIFAFIDPGLAKDANCGPLLSQAKAKGAPVKQSAVRNAPAMRK
ncbi:MAG TPA: AsmA family protein [Rhizomicrobium sp.]|nr:AsmA family protein [Rhizomicrobium sp.]